jgi:hypothetical protein
VKATDNYEAKLEIWARESRAHALPKAAGFPKFPPQKFTSYAEFNRWKRQYLDEIARRGGLKWTN